jgi:protein-disulfide isomerase
MTSGKQARRRRQAQARPPVRSTEGRRASPKVLALGAVGLAGIAAAIALAVVIGSGGSNSTETTGSTLPDAGLIARQLAGIPQRGNVLGKAGAPVTLTEYIDLQCPVCRAFETEVMPTVIRRYVRTGKVKVDARIIAFIGPDSDRGRRGAIAAGQQNRLFDFTQLLYFNQGPENGGWLDDSMVASAAKSIPGVDVQALLAATDSTAVTDTAERWDREAQADGVTGTPTVFVGKSGRLGRGTEVTPGRAPDLPTLSRAILRALG